MQEYDKAQNGIEAIDCVGCLACLACISRGFLFCIEPEWRISYIDKV